MNCLQFALQLWNTQPKYELYYDGDHVINLIRPIQGSTFIPLKDYGLEHILSSFKETLLPADVTLLKKYFKYEK